MDTAVLFLVFNRPDTTARVFEAIRQARPPRLYVAADGPRADRRGEAERCAEVRRIATAVDWPCEVHRLFRDRNLGCKLGVSEGIGWFFDHEPEGIILEDDILPQPGFFSYCEALLARYRDDPRVAMISGCNLVADRHPVTTSYFFSIHNPIWGWASWRRAWSQYDPDMAAWPQWHAEGGLRRWLGGDRCAAEHWRRVFDRMYRREIDTWDYQWTFACWKMQGLTALPAHNLTLNLGFGADATHTVKDAPDYVRRCVPRDLEGPLRHPAAVVADRAADRAIQRHVMGLGHWRCLRRVLQHGLRTLMRAESAPRA